MTDGTQNSGSMSLTHEQFIRLYLQSERELVRYVMAIVPNAADARDILQDTAVALWQKIDQYDPEKPFVAWACRFALNKARAFLRAESRRQRFLADDVNKLLAEQRVAVASKLDARREHLRACLNKLPDEQAELLQARYFDETSVTEMSRIFDRSIESVYKVLQRGRKSLHQCIELQIAKEGA